MYISEMQSCSIKQLPNAAIAIMIISWSHFLKYPEFETIVHRVLLDLFASRYWCQVNMLITEIQIKESVEENFSRSFLLHDNSHSTISHSTDGKKLYPLSTIATVQWKQLNIESIYITSSSIRETKMNVPWCHGHTLTHQEWHLRLWRPSPTCIIN